MTWVSMSRAHNQPEAVASRLVCYDNTCDRMPGLRRLAELAKARSLNPFNLQTMHPNQFPATVGLRLIAGRIAVASATGGKNLNFAARSLWLQSHPTR